MCLLLLLFMSEHLFKGYFIDRIITYQLFYEKLILYYFGFYI